MGPKWLWVLMSPLLVFEAWSSSGCWEQERLALLDLKPFFFNTVDSLNWTKGGGLDCCRWEMVECNITTRRVTTLSLNLNNWEPHPIEDNWYLNASLFLPFEELRRLYLVGNQLVGCVENEGFGKLSKLRHLELLDLSHNYLNGSTLSSLTKISTLKFLNLSGNFLFQESNDINADFKWLSGLSNLESLNLADNNVTNYILSYLDGLSSLRTLILSDNLLKGALKIEGNGKQLRLINLEVLDLSYNNLNNNVLADLSGFSNLKSLDISFNKLKGSIDITEFCALSNLETLDISFNELNQFVTSKENRCLRKLNVLYLDGVSTEQSLSLVSLLEPFSSVKTLFLRCNSNVNKTVVTQELHVLSNVEDLIMDNTPVDFNILRSIGILTSLKTLSLYNCSLTGTLPAQGWCYLKGLEGLSLNGNGLRGSISSCLGNLRFLRYLDISNNEFTGNVASTVLTNLTMLQFLSISNNQFQVPMSFKSFANHSVLKYLFSGGNTLVAEPIGFQTWFPKFQLKSFTLSNCRIDERRKLQLPNFLYYQYDLRYVDLSFNNFGGIRFPDWLAENNTRLEALYMMNSSIDGSLFLPSNPQYNLVVLNISSNQIEHQIPTNICSIFPNLQGLLMSRNAWKGNIPPCLGGMKSLIILDISHNHLVGEIPEKLAMSSSLMALKLSNNYLSGKMFPAMYRSNALIVLYLDGNNFEGEMPQFSPISSSMLEELVLSDNNFSGKLPIWLWNYTSLMVLALTNNQFEGPISSELCNLVNLEFLDLSLNHLSGTLPSCSNSQNIKHVHLRRNKLNGPLPHTFYGRSSLETLDLSENNFTGKIPDWISMLPFLTVLLLKANQFHGEFPMHLCKLYSLGILDLSQNKLSGPIPSCLDNLTLQPRYEKSKSRTFVFLFTILEEISADMGLKLYDLVRNKVVDSIVEFRSSRYSANGLPRSRWYHFSYVEEEIVFSTKRASLNYTGNILDMLCAIDLSCNQLTGIIPFELGNLTEIRGLNLSHNNLTGPIPSTFSKLKVIESLDLSYNNLNDRIPPQLMGLNTLEVFTVAYNNLSGPLPDMKGQFSTFEENSYEGNPLLCGPPLKNSCSKVDSAETPSVLSGKDEQQGCIDMGDFYICFGVSYAIILLAIAIVLYINPYWRHVWFYFIEESSNACYYFIVDNLHKLPCFRRTI